MHHLIRPHGSADLRPLLLEGEALAAEIARAESLPRVPISSREAGDLIMLGNGGFTPLAGFMDRADWEGVCREMRLSCGRPRAGRSSPNAAGARSPRCSCAIRCIAATSISARSRWRSCGPITRGWIDDRKTDPDVHGKTGHTNGKT